MCSCDMLIFIILHDHMLVSVCLLGRTVDVHTKPQTLRLSQYRIGIQISLLKGNKLLTIQMFWYVNTVSVWY